jgi:tRNA (guanine10-N2)-dimethyltransferase
MYHRTLSIDADDACLTRVVERSSYLRNCAREIFHCHPTRAEIVRMSRDVRFDRYLSNGDTFSVRVRSVHPTKVNTLRIEREVGARILNAVENVKVDLMNPDVAFLGVATGNEFFFGKSPYRGSYDECTAGVRGRRPSSHPSAMTQKLARCLVNLARAKVNRLCVDPFCGTGTVLIEAASLGCRVVGSDVDKRMIRKSRQNLSQLNTESIGLLLVDARSMPLNSVVSVATDPPYGRSASTYGTPVEGLAEEFLYTAIDAMVKGGHISMAFPASCPITSIGIDAGYSCLESHQVKVHKNLTRAISVFRKP